MASTRLEYIQRKLIEHRRLAVGLARAREEADRARNRVAELEASRTMGYEEIATLLSESGLQITDVTLMAGLLTEGVGTYPEPEDK